MYAENDEKKIIWERLSKASEENSLFKIWGPRIVQIEITNRCNLTCNMCQRWQWSIQSHTLPLKRLTSLCSELKEMGTETIIFSGGEPLLRNDLQDIINKLSKFKIKLCIFTNGTFMPESLIKTLINNEVSVCFSLDGSTPHTYAKIRGTRVHFKKVIKNIESYVKVRDSQINGQEIVTGINFTLQKLNAHEILSIAQLADKLGVDYLRYELVHGQPNLGPDKEELIIIQEQFQRLKEKRWNMQIYISSLIKGILVGEAETEDIKSGYPALGLFSKNQIQCLKCHQYSLITADGRVFPCTAAYFDNMPLERFEHLREKYVMGNVLESKFSKIWYGNRYEQFRKRTNPIDFQRSPDLKMICGQCEHFYQFKLFQEMLTEYRNTESTKKLPETTNIVYEIERRENELNFKITPKKVGEVK